MPRKNTDTKYLTVRMDDDLLQKLAELANENERSTSSEARLAIKLHVGEALRVPASLRPVAGDDRPAA